MSLWPDERELMVEQLGEDVCVELEQAVTDGKLAHANIAVEITEQRVLDNIVPQVGAVLLPEWQIQVTALLNTPMETFLEHIRINAARNDVPWLTITPEHEGQAVMVGGGSSMELPSQLEEVAHRRKLGQTIFALNGAAKYLTDRHMKPNYLVLCDGRPENVKFLHGLPAERFLLSSQCHPSLFDYLVEHGADVTMFHPAIEGLSEALPRGRPFVMVGGSITVGYVGMSAATTMGYRMLHLYGYDSSDSDDGRCHAYIQQETSAESKRLDVVCAGRKFHCSFVMFKQAQAFIPFVNMLSQFGCTLTVHGDGLIPTIAHQMTERWPLNAACYDMSLAPASFDFIKWLVVAEMDRIRRGAEAPLKVAFTDGPEDGFRAGDVQNLAEKQQIMDKVMRPALQLFGAVETDEAKTGRQHHYWYRPITDAARIGEPVPRVKVPVRVACEMVDWLIEKGVKAGAPLVITLRETRYSPDRNSDVASWTEFARRRRAEGEQVVFVRDTAKADEPIEDFLICPRAARDLHDRVALYALARCNLLIANGPAELLQFSDWPFIEFKPLPVEPLRPVAIGDTWWQRFGGITPPESFPWLGPHQLTVWQRDTIDVLEDAWQRWLKATEK